MSHIYSLNSSQAKKYSLDEYSDRFVILKTGKGKKPIQRIPKMKNYRDSHLSREELWVKRFGIRIKTSTGVDYSYRKNAA